MEKIKSDLNQITCSQKAFAQAVGLTPARINQLIDEDIIIVDEFDKQRGVIVFDSLKNYFLSKNVSGSGVDFWKERSLHERAKRQLAELKLDQEKGKLYLADQVELTLAELFTIFRNNLLGLPSKLSAQLENKSRAEIFNALTQEIDSALTDLSNHNSA